MSAASLLRQTTEEMANRASVPMDVWDRHSNAALQAANRIEALEAENGAIKTAFRVNMLRLMPEMSHAEIDAEIEKAVSK